MKMWWQANKTKTVKASATEPLLKSAMGPSLNNQFRLHYLPLYKIEEVNITGPVHLVLLVSAQP